MSTSFKENKRIGIVYFVYINSKKNYKRIIKAQLKDLCLSGVLNDASLHLVVNIADDVNCKQSLSDFFNSLNISFSSITYSEENSFEYEGIKKLYELALSDKYDYLSYFHTKGMSYRIHLLFKRTPREIVLTFLTFSNYKKIVKLFDNNPKLNKICPFPSLEDISKNEQWCWFNFYWIRASYVKHLEIPKKTSDRFYYERWTKLINEENSLNSSCSCYSLYSNSYRGFSQSEASQTLRKLGRCYKYLFPVSRLYLLLNYFIHK